MKVAYKAFTSSCLLILASFLLISCSESNIQALETIDIGSNINNFKEVNLSQFSTRISYVPLKTIDNFIFTGIWECEFSDNYLIAKNINKCILYDLKGNVISIIGKKGRGPGEYPYIDNVRFGPDKTILIQSLYDLYEYNFKGEFLRKYAKIFLADNDLVGSWLPINDSLYLGKISSNKGNEQNKAIIFNRSGKIKTAFKNYIIFNRERALSGETERFADIYFYDNKIYFKEIFNDTLFYLQDNDLVPEYVSSLGKYQEPLSHRENRLMQKDRGFQTEWLNYIYLENVFQSKDFLFLDCDLNSHFPAKRLSSRTVMGNIKLEYNTTHALGIYDKKQKSTIFCKPTSTDNPLYTSGLYNDIDGGPRFFPMQMINDSKMAMWFDAKQLKDHIKSDDFIKSNPKNPEQKNALKNLADRISEFDNAILMIVEFQ